MGRRYLPTASLRLKFVALSGAIILVVSLGLTWSFIRQTNHWFVRNLEEVGLSKVEELTTAAISALREGDRGGLSRLIQKTFTEARVTYVGILDAKGTIFASRLNRHRLGEVPSTVLEKAQEVSGPASISVENHIGQTTYFFVTPVVEIANSKERRLGSVVLGISSIFLQRDIRELTRMTFPISVGFLVVGTVPS